MAPITTLFELTTLIPNDLSKVVVTGFFDLFHSEHRHFLIKAKSQAQFLIVGVESDLRARQLKSFSRPYQTQQQRALQLSRFESVDLVVLLPLNFNQPYLRELFIQLIKPQILAVSSHSPHQSQKRLLIKKYGGQLKVVYSQNPNISTTILGEKLYNQAS